VASLESTSIADAQTAVSSIDSSIVYFDMTLPQNTSQTTSSTYYDVVITVSPGFQHDLHWLASLIALYENCPVAQSDCNITTADTANQVLLASTTSAIRCSLTRLRLIRHVWQLLQPQRRLQSSSTLSSVERGIWHCRQPKECKHRDARSNGLQQVIQWL
jgi:RNase P/RNase MRP subunit p30